VTVDDLLADRLTFDAAGARLALAAGEILLEGVGDAAELAGRIDLI